MSDGASVNESLQGQWSECVRPLWEPPGRSTGKVAVGHSVSRTRRIRRTLDIECPLARTSLREGLNDPEMTMSNALNSTNLIAHEKALQAAGDFRGGSRHDLVAAQSKTLIPRPRAVLADAVSEDCRCLCLLPLSLHLFSVAAPAAVGQPRSPSPQRITDEPYA